MLEEEIFEAGLDGRADVSGGSFGDDVEGETDAREGFAVQVLQARCQCEDSRLFQHACLSQSVDEHELQWVVGRHYGRTE